jgi:hypothetical protein
VVTIGISPAGVDDTSPDFFRTHRDAPQYVRAERHADGDVRGGRPRRKKEFSDFVLGRFTRASLVKQPARVTVSADKAWQKMVAARLIAHHELPEPQQRVLRTEYVAGAQARRISTRAALVPYLIQDLRAAIDPQKEHPPDFQMEVANLAEIRPWLFSETFQ